MNPDLQATARTRRRYQRLAPIYDRMEGLSERHFRRWRPRLWEFVRGPKILEVGVGTGKNMPFYPRQAAITAIDLTPGMLDRARQRAQRLGIEVDLQLGDVQQLTFPDHAFDTAVATCVVLGAGPGPGLARAGPGGSAGRPDPAARTHAAREPAPGNATELLTPLFVRLTGANLNRRTLDNIRAAGLQIEAIEDLAMAGMFKFVVRPA
jgi:hypothetical protein